MFWCLDPVSRSLLERMHDPNIRTDLYRIHHPKSIASIRESNLKDAGAESFHRLGNIRFAAFGGYGQRG